MQRTSDKTRSTCSSMRSQSCSRVRRFFQEWLGNFSPDELKKFIFLGIIFGFVIGIYWALRPIKDSVFMSMVGAKKIASAKIFSLLLLFPIVTLLGKLVSMFPKHRILYVLGVIYAFATLGFGLLLNDPVIGLPNVQVDASRMLGWFWYVFVESYGSIMVASFWAFALDITAPESAKKGFPLVVLIGQLGSVLSPLYITPLASPQYWGSSSYVIMFTSALILIIALLVAIFVRVIPESQMVGYRAHGSEEVEHKTGFFEGLKLLVSHGYLLGIFAIISIYEIIVTIIDFQFKNKVSDTVFDESSRALYLGEYAYWVNVVACTCLILGVSNIQRRLGLKVSLALMPCIVAIAVLTFYVYQQVDVLFWIMVSAKGINYALNGPAIKQLYVPTSTQVKYKSQAWIETFGSRSSKALGSTINKTVEPLVTAFGPMAGQAVHIALTSIVSGGLLVVWFVIALYLGKQYNEAIEEERVVC